tara:strand:+ start:364 stop:846 length:483 start_codon:yes stop_codon:yes gene_type:complete
MIQLTYSELYNFNITTEDVRIDTSVITAQIRHLLKFTNDMDKEVKYAYGRTETIYPRYTNMTLLHNTVENLLTGAINFLPCGYWKYSAWEVSFNGEPNISATTVPLTEDGVATDQSGIYGTVKGCVEVGKLFVEERSGSEQVQYTQYREPSGTNYIWYGQ